MEIGFILKVSWASVKFHPSQLPTVIPPNILVPFTPSYMCNQETTGDFGLLISWFSYEA